MKRRKLHIDEDLLIRYLAGEAAESESATVESWLGESPDHQQILSGYRTIFEESKALRPGQFGNADKAWQRFKQKIDECEETGPAGYSFKRWLAIAAAVLFVLSVSALVFLRRAPILHFYAHEQPLVDSLPDGSLISLSRHSSLVYKPGRVREATLKGEAFFEVKHNMAHPFRIKVNDLLINVLGTSFNVKSIGEKTEIKVRTGVVGVSGENQSMRIEAGEQLLTIPGQNWHKEAQSGFDISSYPGLLRAILKDPKKWPELLKNYRPKQDALTASGKNKALVSEIIHQFITEKIAADGTVKTFRLDGDRLIINGIIQPNVVQQRYKAKYLPLPDYFIYFGNEHPKGNGICVSPDHF